jgi:hypothetical protein
LDDPLDRRLGYLLGSADLIGQMSDRVYLEKCRDFLYPEFVLAGIAEQRNEDGSANVVYASPQDLLVKTPLFYDMFARKRLEVYFEGVYRYAAAHFSRVNLYYEEISRNMNFSHFVLDTSQFDLLRRKSLTLSAFEDQPS